MKKSNKMATAGVGLLIAAAAGIGPAIASDGSASELEAGNTLDVSGVSAGVGVGADGEAAEATSSPANEDPSKAEGVTPPAKERQNKSDVLDVDGVKVTDSTEPADDSEAATEEEASGTEVEAPQTVEQTLDPVEVGGVSVEATETTEPEVVVAEETEAPVVSGERSANEADKVTEPANDSASTTDAEESKDNDTEATDVTDEEAPEVTRPEVKKTIEPIEVSPEAVPVPEVEKEQPAAPKTEVKEQSASSVATPAPKKQAVAPVPVVKVNYVPATASLATSRSLNTVGELAAPAKPQQLGPVLPLVEAASETPATQGTVNLQHETAGVQTENGQSMVVWFELPPAEGPALHPGQVTAPLLGSAVTETAVNSNVIPAAEVAPQQVPAGTTATASAAVPVANTTAAEHGVMARTLARTGSLAQYAAMLSAVAMIVGVGMLIGAAAARRHQD